MLKIDAANALCRVRTAREKYVKAMADEEIASVGTYSLIPATPAERAAWKKAREAFEDAEREMTEANEEWATTFRTLSEEEQEVAREARWAVDEVSQ